MRIDPSLFSDINFNHFEFENTEETQKNLDERKTSFDWHKKIHRKGIFINRRSIRLIPKTVFSCVKTKSRNIFEVISGIVKKILGIKVSVDENNLIRGHEKIKKYEQSWFLNLALLKDSMDSLELSEEEKNEIRFLVDNYLHKGAPIHIQTMESFFDELDKKFQVTGFLDRSDHYHRCSIAKQMKIGEKLDRKHFYLGGNSPLILTDTTEFEHLLPMKFHVVDIAKHEKNEFTDYLESYFDGKETRKKLKKTLDRPFLIDFTKSLGKNIKIEGASKNKTLFESEFDVSKKELEDCLENAVDRLIENNPSLKSYRKQILKYTKRNTTCVCRVQIKDDLAGIKVLPFFSDLSIKKLEDTHSSLISFVISTGIGVGALRLRREMNSLDNHSDVKYGIKNSIKKKEKENCEDIKNLETSNCYKEFKALSSELAHSDPHTAVLVKATADLLTKAFCKIEPKWKTIDEHPVYADIAEISLFKIQNFLATATLRKEDYSAFAEQIELIHAELATLLELFRPYEESEFENIYKKNIKIPDSLQECLKAGLGKTSVNLCAGIMEAAETNNTDMQAVYSEGFYFEQAGFVGYENQFKRLFAKDANTSNTRKVNLYFGQFNPNIEIDPKFTHYERRDISKDIRDLINGDKIAPHLTVAIDCTIDQFESKNISDLLSEFEDEVKNGQLNFIFFHSGQKFDMLGMDSYYGSPYIIVNNNQDQWERFNLLTKKDVHKTDPLSLQWFCLSNDCASDSLARYRELIFENTRAILNAIPENLKPDPKATDKEIRVNTVSEDMDACFIDIKVQGLTHKIKSINLLGLLYDRMIKEGVKIQTRATFGLYHANALIIDTDESDVTTMRLHPGLNSKENRIFIDFFEELSQLV